MSDAHKNFAYSTVATAPSPATSGTSLVVQTGDGSLFPTPPFNATIWPASTQPTTANAEIVRVTNISTDTFTITRTQESTSARTVIIGDQISATITAKTLTDVEGVANAAYTPGGTDVAVTDGGTGASTASGARTNLGVAIGSNVQAWDSDLDTIAGLTPTTDNFMVANASAWASRTPSQARTHMGLGALATLSTVGTSTIDNASVTADKLSTGATSNQVTTDQATASTSYTDLTTSGPAVTVTVGANGLLLVGVGANTNNNGTGEDYMSFAMSGANTLAASDQYAYEAVSFVAGAKNAGSREFLFTGLTAGSTTITAKYRTNTSTGNWHNRQIWAIPL